MALRKIAALEETRLVWSMAGKPTEKLFATLATVMRDA